jgi:hypothetical protein
MQQTAARGSSGQYGNSLLEGQMRIWRARCSLEFPKGSQLPLEVSQVNLTAGGADENLQRPLEPRVSKMQQTAARGSSGQ